MDQQLLSPAAAPGKMQPPLSPLRSPRLRRHFAPFETNIHFPNSANNFESKPEYKNVSIGKDEYLANFDVHDFKPEEISMKTIGHTIIVTLKHDEKNEGGQSTIQRHLIKKFVVPPTMDIEKIKSWTSNGVLYLRVPHIQTSSSELNVLIERETPSD